MSDIKVAAGTKGGNMTLYIPVEQIAEANLMQYKMIHLSLGDIRRLRQIFRDYERGEDV